MAKGSERMKITVVHPEYHQQHRGDFLILEVHFSQVRFHSLQNSKGNRDFLVPGARFTCEEHLRPYCWPLTSFLQTTEEFHK